MQPFDCAIERIVEDENLAAMLELADDGSPCAGALSHVEWIVLRCFDNAHDIPGWITYLLTVRVMLATVAERLVD